MNSLLVKILIAIITFVLGVAISNLWLGISNQSPSICPLPAEPPAARLEMVFVVDTTRSIAPGLYSAFYDDHQNAALTPARVPYR